MWRGETRVLRLFATARETTTRPGSGTVIIESGMVDYTPVMNNSSAGARRIRDSLAFYANNAISVIFWGPAAGAKFGINAKACEIQRAGPFAM